MLEMLSAFERAHSAVCVYYLFPLFPLHCPNVAELRILCCKYVKLKNIHPTTLGCITGCILVNDRGRALNQ